MNVKSPDRPLHARAAHVCLGPGELATSPLLRRQVISTTCIGGQNHRWAGPLGDGLDDEDTLV